MTRFPLPATGTLLVIDLPLVRLSIQNDPDDRGTPVGRAVVKASEKYASSAAGCHAHAGSSSASHRSNLGVSRFVGHDSSSSRWGPSTWFKGLIGGFSTQTTRDLARCPRTSQISQNLGLQHRTGIRSCTPSGGIDAARRLPALPQDRIHPHQHYELVLARPPKDHNRSYERFPAPSTHLPDPA